MKRPSRGPLALTLVLAFAPLYIACNDRSDPSKHALQSAGGLSESRMPRGLIGESPAPTGRVEADHRLEQGWQKNARPGEKMPTYGDHASY
jgi:hypothetical protein